MRADPVRLTAIATLALVAGCGDDSPTAPTFHKNHGPSAPEYAFQEFDVPSEMGSGTSAFGINNRGTIVGNFLTIDGAVDGFVFDRGTFTDIALPDADPAARGVLNAINDLGTAAGSFVDASTGALRGFTRRKHGQVTVLPDPAPGTPFLDALGINTHGTVVGTFAGATGLRGFFFSKGTYRVFDHPGARSTRVEGINDKDVAVGTWVDAARRTHGFMLKGDELVLIDPPGAIVTIPHSINNKGVVAGSYLDATFTFHGFLFSNGAFTIIDFPGATDTELLGINDRGVLVGSYDGFTRGFVAKPGH